MGKYKQTILFLIIFFGLNNCSFRNLWLNNSEYLAYWQIDSYFNLNPEQKKKTKLILKQYWIDIKCKKIPLINKDLDIIKTNFTTDKEGPKESWLRETAKKWQYRIRDLIVNDSALFLNSLSIKQWKYFKNKIKEKNKKYSDFFAKELNEQKEEYLEENIDRFQVYFGSVEIQQKSKLMDIFNRNMKKYPFYFKQRLNAQENFIAFFNTKKNIIEIKKKLSDWIIDPELLRSFPIRKEFLEERKRRFKIPSQINQILLDKQRKYFNDFISELQEDLIRFSDYEKNCNSSPL